MTLKLTVRNRCFRGEYMRRPKAHRYVQVQAELVEFICPSCEKGVLRVDESKRPTQTWKHKCSHCTYEGELAAPFPLIKYKGEEFILNKHVPRPSPLPDSSLTSKSKPSN